MSTTVFPETELEEGTETKSKILPPYHVILMNDDDHSVDYVVAMMQKLFGYTVEQGIEIAKKVHFEGRCIVKTCSKELAELKQEQIHAYGPDKLIPRCKGSMSCIIEPAA
jgi:ATP-dependent Clp protease adaptor protein ClpS